MAYSKKVSVSKNRHGEKGLFAMDEIQNDEIIIVYGSTMLDRPTRTSVQIDEDKHIEGTEDTIAFLNHSCEPNAYIDFGGVYLRAIRNIKAGEEITLNYLTADSDLHTKFACHCGSPRCYGEIRGFKYLTQSQKFELKEYLSPYLRKQLEKEAESGATE
jgi:SET domain-containing protein